MANVARSGKNDLVDLKDPLVELVRTITQEYDKEDRNERDEKRPLWMRLENYFNGLQNIYWDTTAKDFKKVDNDPGSNRHYDKIINSYRAHAESIIAALSIRTPTVVFYPDDAEEESDIVTARACIKIKEDIEKFNAGQLLMIKTLLILFNQGVVAAYIYNRSDSKYGTYSQPVYGKDTKKVHTIQSNCPECGSNIKEDVFEDEKGKVPEQVMQCEVCGHEGVADQEEYEEEVPVIVASTLHPKNKTCIELFSPLFVYLPFYARRQEHMPYLRLRFEQHYSALKNQYPKLKKKGFNPSVDAQNSDERGIRVGLNSSNLCTVDCWWIRDWAYDIIDDKDDEIKELKKKYPDGIYAIFIDEQLVEITNENLDTHWHISENPFSTYVHADPLGKSLAPIQELQNEVVDLQIETFEHSIPETHARGDVVDFKKYGKERARPGMMYPTMIPPDGTRLGDAFHTIKTATLTEESDLFLKRLEEKAQFVSGSFPSIFGGPATSGSKTAREYIESRSAALQRHSLTWTIQKVFWAGVMSLAVPLRIKALRQVGQDEKVVEKVKTGFINNWIKMVDLEGNVGRVESDVDEEMPLSPSQLKGLLTDLMALKDDNLNEAIYHPQNTPLVKKALGATDFYIPGSDERDKQYAEFTSLLNGEAVEISELDNHAVEAETCKTFVNSPTGLILRKHNPEGIMAIEEHYKQHKQAEMLMMQAGIPPDQNQAVTSPGTANPVSPAKENSNVQG